MRLPIQYAMTYPERVAASESIPGLDLVGARRLRFEKPSGSRFPCLELGRAALEAGGALPCALNAADEIAVEAFLAHRLRFSDIPRVIEAVMEQTAATAISSLDDVMKSDLEARRRAREVVEKLTNGSTN
jgi:1-deoxy-D-xylulose-5-phosphate reductoisomerase